jgi:hypothetical protein
MRPALPLLLLAVTACAHGIHTKATDSTLAAHDTLTRHQKDSVVAHSALPGASVVGKAITVQDSGASHQHLVDSIANNP